MRLPARFAAVAAVAALSACTPPGAVSTVPMGPGAQPQNVYKIRASQEDDIKVRMLDSLNALRAAANLSQLQMDARLNAAAATHSRDMSIQNRPWHFGSDGSSPIDRVARAGYAGGLVGETISETYETETETLAAWMAQPDTRTVLLDPRARQMGFDWFQEPNGKIWWTLVLGS